MRIQIHRSSMGIRLSGSDTIDKVLLNGLICKLKKLGISGSFLKLRQSYLDIQFQRTLLHVQNSEWKPANVKASVPLDRRLFKFMSVVYLVIY